MTHEQKCRAHCLRRGIDPDRMAPSTWQKIPGQRTDGKVLMWHTVIGEVTCKRTTNNRNKEAEASKADLQRMIDESDKKKPGKRYSCYDGD